MNARRLANLLVLLATFIAPAAESAPAVDAAQQQSGETTADSRATADTKVPDVAASTADVKPLPSGTNSGATTNPDVFSPSENISEDMAVAYPVDI